MAYNQDELSQLFQRNLSLQQPPPSQTPTPAPTHHTEIKYSISQHYHHSSHTAPSAPQQQTDDHTIAIILSRHGVDPSSLTPSQVALFRTASSTQQMRLVELWRISPPTYGGHALPQSMDGTVPATDFEMSAHSARERERYDRAQMEQDLQASAMMQQDDVMSEDSNSASQRDDNAPLTPIQGGDGRWASPPEPYMESGYEALARREYEASQAQPQQQGQMDADSLFGAGVGGEGYRKWADPVYASMGAVGRGWEERRGEERREMEMAMRYGGWQGDEEML